MPDAAVVGGDRGRGEEIRPGRVHAIPKADHDGRCRPVGGWWVGIQLVLPDGQRRDPHAAADQQRLAILVGIGEAVAERPDQEQLLAGLQLAEPIRARADILDEKLELALARPQHAEGAGQERPLALSPAPPLRRLEHVELPRAGSRPGWVAAAQHDIGTVGLARGDGGRAAAERSGRPAHATSVGRGSGWGPLIPWISWSERTSGSPRRAEAIARAAAIPPAIVVMQGIPRAIAAERIS